MALDVDQLLRHLPGGECACGCRQTIQQAIFILNGKTSAWRWVERPHSGAVPARIQLPDRVRELAEAA